MTSRNLHPNGRVPVSPGFVAPTAVPSLSFGPGASFAGMARVGAELFRMVSRFGPAGCLSGTMGTGTAADRRKAFLTGSAVGLSLSEIGGL